MPSSISKLDLVYKCLTLLSNNLYILVESPRAPTRRHIPGRWSVALTQLKKPWGNYLRTPVGAGGFVNNSTVFQFQEFCPRFEHEDGVTGHVFKSNQLLCILWPSRASAVEQEIHRILGVAFSPRQEQRNVASKNTLLIPDMTKLWHWGVAPSCRPEDPYAC